MIKKELISQCSAGTDTTRTTLYWLVEYMAMYPEIQKKMQDEIDSVMGRSRFTNFNQI